jgi:hypothetical protein
VFPVRYGLNLYILFRGNSVFKALIFSNEQIVACFLGNATVISGFQVW